MGLNGVDCRIRIQGEQLEQIDAFVYLGSLITDDPQIAVGNQDKIC